MPGFLISLLAKPKVLGAIGIALAFVAMAAFYQFKVWGLRADLLEVRAQLQDAKDMNVTLRQQLLELGANRDALERTIKEQNRAIAELQRRAASGESAATLRAVRTLREGERTRTEMEGAAGNGPAAMNTWLHDTFTPPQ